MTNRKQVEPPATRTDLPSPTNREGGAASEATLEMGVSSQAPKVVPGTEPIEETGFQARYERRRVLGRGGMGEVHLCKDHRIGREIAMKVVNRTTGSKADRADRFVLEARVQGQLEHPGIAPVYDLGVAPDRTAYFTMKRVRGETLEQIVARLADGEPEATQKYTRRRLLSALTSLCLTVDFVHSRGVFHRDLKPANVMLGDFGEVYLLDWGLAKTVESVDAKGAAAEPMDLAAFPPAQTAAGVLLGTPGYMAPERLAGVLGAADARAEVYSIGAILFEILALEPLHHCETVAEIIRSTFAGADTRTSVRAPQRDVPPELEAICKKATAQDPSLRYATARELCEAIERYLEGDRDLTLRREMAVRHLEAAERLLRTEGPPEERYRQAGRELTRALALDPEQPAAMKALVRLLMDPPRELPAEVERELEELSENQVRVGARTGALAYLSMNLFVPFVLWMGARHWSVSLFFALITAAGATSWLITRVRRARGGHSMLVLLASTLAVVAASAYAGPFFLVPGYLAVNCLIFSMNNDRKWRPLILVAGCVGALLPVLAEALGVVPPSLAFSREGLVLLPRAVWFPPTPTLAMMIVANLSLVVTGCVAIIPFRNAFDEGQRRIRLLAWQLRQLVPDSAAMAAPTETRGAS